MGPISLSGSRGGSGFSKPSRFGGLLQSWTSLTEKCSNFLFEWTPFILVLTYYVASTALYTSANEDAIKVFYFFYMSVNFYIAACTVVEAFLGVSPVRDARAAAIRVQDSGLFPSSDELMPIMDIVIVAYLPNERDIVKDQVSYGYRKSLSWFLLLTRHHRSIMLLTN